MVEWITSPAPVPYLDAIAAMEAHVDAMIAGDAGERVWLNSRFIAPAAVANTPIMGRASAWLM